MTAIAHRPSTHFDRTGIRTATEPPEHRGLARDAVRLLVARAAGVSHHTFAELPSLLATGDLLVVNTSQTLAAQLSGLAAGDWPVVLHLGGRLDDGNWAVELRTAPDAARPILTARPGEVFRFGEGALRVQLLEPYPPAKDGPGRAHSPTGSGNRLWRARIESPLPVADYLARYGRPISYGYLSRPWPLTDYQTIFGIHPGSVEMPSAGRPFTPELVTRLVAEGIVIAPITLHTGVSSQEAGEGPQPEQFWVPATTARLVNQTRAAGGRVIAVGTTVTRALESAAGEDGLLSASSGWTDRVLGPEYPVRVVGGLITGLHDPQASHLLLVESVAGAELAQRAYDEAVGHGYLWHEFGDSCLLLSDRD